MNNNNIITTIDKTLLDFDQDFPTGQIVFGGDVSLTTIDELMKNIVSLKPKSQDISLRYHN